jgi:exonuclease III
MGIATFNVNSVNARLPVLLRWVAQAKPDIACLQEFRHSAKDGRVDRDVRAMEKTSDHAPAWVKLADHGS